MTNRMLILSLVLIVNITTLTLISTLPIDNYLLALAISRGLLVFQFLLLGIGMALLYRRRIDELHYTVFFLLPIYVSSMIVKGFSSGLAHLPPDVEILPRMRASVAFKSLTDTARLDTRIDPHLAYPQEFITVYVLKLITGSTIIDLYETVMKALSIAFWSLLSLLLLKLLINTLIQDNIVRFFFIALISSVLITFQPGYSGEMTYAYPLLVIVLYMLKSHKKTSLVKVELIITIMLLSVGIVLGSQRETFTLLLFSSLLLLFNSFNIKSYETYNITLPIITLTAIQLLYNAWLYSRGYLNYFQSLLWVVKEIFLEAGKIVRPPLYTLKQTPNVIDMWINYLGSVSFFITLFICGFISLTILTSGFYELLSSRKRGKGKADIDILDLAVVVTFFVFGGIIAVQYIANLFGFWTIDFESTIPLIRAFLLYIPVIGARVLLKTKSMHTTKCTSTRSRHGRFVEIAIMILVFLSFAPSAFGLPLRTFIKTYSDVVEIRGDPVEMTLLANSVYRFMVSRYSSQYSFVLDSRFSGHYLNLPLKYAGFDVTTSVFDNRIGSSVRDCDAVILASEGFVAYIKLDKIYIYDGEYVIMPY